MRPATLASRAPNRRRRRMPERTWASAAIRELRRDRPAHQPPMPASSRATPARSQGSHGLAGLTGSVAVAGWVLVADHTGSQQADLSGQQPDGLARLHHPSQEGLHVVAVQPQQRRVEDLLIRPGDLDPAAAHHDDDVLGEALPERPDQVRELLARRHGRQERRPNDQAGPHVRPPAVDGLGLGQAWVVVDPVGGQRVPDPLDFGGVSGDLRGQRGRVGACGRLRRGRRDRRLGRCRRCLLFQNRDGTQDLVGHVVVPQHRLEIGDGPWGDVVSADRDLESLNDDHRPALLRPPGVEVVGLLLHRRASVVDGRERHDGDPDRRRSDRGAHGRLVEHGRRARKPRDVTRRHRGLRLVERPGRRRLPGGACRRRRGTRTARGCPRRPRRYNARRGGRLLRTGGGRPGRRNR